MTCPYSVSRVKMLARWSLICAQFKARSVRAASSRTHRFDISQSSVAALLVQLRASTIGASSGFSASMHERTQDWMALNKLKMLDQTVKTQHVPGAFDNEVAKDAGINDVVVEN
jgi:hypothetical protein